MLQDSIVKIQIKNIEGFAIDQQVDVVVNSANGYLLLGSGSAGRIREVTPNFSLTEISLNRVC